MELITLAVSVVLALAGYLITYGNNLRLHKRKARLERVERQLRDLYGPLLSQSEAAHRAWTAFRRRYRPGHTGYLTGDPPPTEGDLEAWRAWMYLVFQPINEEVADLITHHADLIVEAEMPECLLDIYAHVVGYRPVITAWEKGDFSRHTSLYGHPTQPLLEYARSRYQLLKSEQARLIGKKG